MLLCRERDGRTRQCEFEFREVVRCLFIESILTVSSRFYLCYWLEWHNAVKKAIHSLAQYVSLLKYALDEGCCIKQSVLSLLQPPTHSII